MMPKKLKITIIVLSTLFALSICILGGILVYGYFAPLKTSPSIINDNIITSHKNQLTSTKVIKSYINCQTVKSFISSTNSFKINTRCPVMMLNAVGFSNNDQNTELYIYRNHSSDIISYSVNDMFPGDKETKSYPVKVSFKGTINVHFQTNILSGYEKLAEVLKCKIYLNETGEELYDGLMRDMPSSIDCKLFSKSETTEKLTYNITVYLDTSLGNEYMNQELVANFHWWAEENSYDPGSSQQSSFSKSTPTIPINSPTPNISPLSSSQPQSTPTTANPDEQEQIEENPEILNLPSPTSTINPNMQTIFSSTNNMEQTENMVKPAYSAEPNQEKGELIVPPHSKNKINIALWVILIFIFTSFIILLLGKSQKGEEYE